MFNLIVNIRTDRWRLQNTDTGEEVSFSRDEADLLARMFQDTFGDDEDDE